MGKPGYKTTEFWLMAAVVVVALISGSGLIEQTATEWDDKIVGFVVAAFGALGYSVARMKVKIFGNGNSNDGDS